MSPNSSHRKEVAAGGLIIVALAISLVYVGEGYPSVWLRITLVGRPDSGWGFSHWFCTYSGCSFGPAYGFVSLHFNGAGTLNVTSIAFSGKNLSLSGTFPMIWADYFQVVNQSVFQLPTSLKFGVNGTLSCAEEIQPPTNPSEFRPCESDYVVVVTVHGTWTKGPLRQPVVLMDSARVNWVQAILF